MATGNLQSDRFQTLTPHLQIPLSDKLALPLSQQGRICGFFEAQFFRCMEAYGAKLGRKYCDFENRDLNECLHGEKQSKRAEAIKKERQRLYQEKKIEQPFEENHPEPGHFKPDHFQWNRIN